jgi:hypothetical protein
VQRKEAAAALSALLSLGGCIQRELSSKLADAEAAIARGDHRGARAQLNAIDLHYGGLAAPAIIDLEAKLEKLGTP